MDRRGRSSLTHSAEWFWDHSSNSTHTLHTDYKQHRLHTHTTHTHAHTTHIHTHKLHTHAQRLHIHTTHRYAHRLHTHNTTDTHYTHTTLHTHTSHRYMHTLHTHTRTYMLFINSVIISSVIQYSLCHFFTSSWVVFRFWVVFQVMWKLVWVIYFHFLWVSCKELSLVALWKFCKAPWRTRPLVHW